jgi:hypothetical protein
MTGAPAQSLEIIAAQGVRAALWRLSHSNGFEVDVVV